MAIVGMAFTKINAEKSVKAHGALEVTHDFYIDGVESMPVKLGAKQQEVVQFNFVFAVKYEPNNSGFVTLGGHVLYMAKEEDQKEIMDKWEKEKKIDKALAKLVLGHIVSKANMEAAIVAREIALPPPFPLPRLKVGEKK